MHPSYWYEALRRRLVCAVSELCPAGSVNCPLHVIVNGLLVEEQCWTTQEKIEFVFDGLRAHIARLQGAAAQASRCDPAEIVCGARFDIMCMHAYAQNVQLAASVSFLQRQATQYATVIESLQWTAAHTQRQHAEQLAGRRAAHPLCARGYVRGTRARCCGADDRKRPHTRGTVGAVCAA